MPVLTYISSRNISVLNKLVAFRQSASSCLQVRLMSHSTKQNKVSSLTAAMMCASVDQTFLLFDAVRRLKVSSRYCRIINSVFLIFLSFTISHFYYLDKALVFKICGIFLPLCTLFLFVPGRRKILLSVGSEIWPFPLESLLAFFSLITVSFRFL